MSRDRGQVAGEPRSAVQGPATVPDSSTTPASVRGGSAAAVQASSATTASTCADSTCRKTMTYDELAKVWWAEEDADYIRSRSARYRGAVDLEPEWTQEVMADEHLVELSPYPASRVGASGFIGWSSSAGRVLVVMLIETSTASCTA